MIALTEVLLVKNRRVKVEETKRNTTLQKHKINTSEKYSNNLETRH